MIFLKQSTSSQEIPLGRFVDSADGNTEETALTINNTDIKLWKTGATTLASKNSGGATHIANGEYYCVLDSTDTDTLGPMKVTVHVSGALPVQVFCCVLSASVYDALIGTGDLLTKIADTLLNRDMSAVSDTNSRSPLNALRVLRNKTTISSGTLTVYEEDDSTSAWTGSVSADSTASPITGVDPS